MRRKPSDRKRMNVHDHRKTFWTTGTGSCTGTGRFLPRLPACRTRLQHPERNFARLYTRLQQSEMQKMIVLKILGGIVTFCLVLAVLSFLGGNTKDARRIMVVLGKAFTVLIKVLSGVLIFFAYVAAGFLLAYLGVTFTGVAIALFACAGIVLILLARHKPQFSQHAGTSLICVLSLLFFPMVAVISQFFSNNPITIPQTPAWANKAIAYTMLAALALGGLAIAITIGIGLANWCTDKSASTMRSKRQALWGGVGIVVIALVVFSARRVVKPELEKSAVSGSVLVVSANQEAVSMKRIPVMILDANQSQQEVDFLSALASNDSLLNRHGRAHEFTLSQLPNPDSVLVRTETNLEGEFSFGRVSLQGSQPYLYSFGQLGSEVLIWFVPLDKEARLTGISLNEKNAVRRRLQ